MKQIFKKIIKYILYLLSKIYSYNTVSKINSYKDLIYSNWLANEFNFLGRNSILSRPCDVKGGEFITIGDGVTIGKNSIINAWSVHEGVYYKPKITIGDYAHLGEEIHISAIVEISIGKNVLTGRRVSIIDNSHGDLCTENFNIPPTNRILTSKGAIIIEDNVWIGDRVSIMSGVTIGKGAIIGANAVVTKDIPANSVAGGIPAIVIKMCK